MESQWIKALESSVKSKINTSKIYADALNETLRYLYKKDILEKTSNYTLAKSIYCESVSKTVVYHAIKQSSCESSVYNYKKYIIKTFYLCYTELAHLPYTEDFEDIYNCLMG